MKADVLIIGGGLMGFSTALHLAMRGIHSLVLDKDSPGQHASGVNAGGLRQLHGSGHLVNGNRMGSKAGTSENRVGLVWEHLRGSIPMFSA